MRSLFWFTMGALAGAILTAFGGLGMLMALADTGIHVTADVGDYPDLVGRVLREEASAEIPLVLEQVERDVSRAVSERMAGTLSSAGIIVYGVEMTLPPEAVRMLEDSMTELLAQELAWSLSTWPWDQLIETWVARAEELIDDMVLSDLATPFEIDLGLHRVIPAIPVYVRLETPSP